MRSFLALIFILQSINPLDSLKTKQDESNKIIGDYRFKELTNILLKGRKKGYDDALMEAFINHTKSTLKWVEKKKWSWIKGQLICASGRAAKKGAQGYASRKVECGNQNDRVWLGAFIIVDDDGLFYLTQNEKFVKCSNTVYTFTLSGESDGCLRDGFAEWGPDEEITESPYSFELGKLKYKKLEKNTPHIKGNLYCEEKIKKKKTEKIAIPEGETVMIIKNPSLQHCINSMEAPWLDDFKVHKKSSFDVSDVRMYFFCNHVTYTFKLKNSQICDQTALGYWEGKQDMSDLGEILLKAPYEDDEAKPEKSEDKKAKDANDEGKAEKPAVKKTVKGAINGVNKFLKKLF